MPWPLYSTRVCYLYDQQRSVNNYESCLCQVDPIFGLRRAPHGRLMNLRTVLFKFGPDANHQSSFNVGAARRANRPGTPADRDALWRSWTYYMFSENRFDRLSFPALENLTMDFSD